MEKIPKGGFIMRTILLGNSDMLMRVFSKDTLNSLKADAGLDAEVVTYTQLKQLNSPMSDVEAIFGTWGIPPLSEDELEKWFPNLRVLFYAAGSVKNFATPFLNRGVKVTSAYAANAIPVAEYTVAQIILAAKGFFASSPLYSSGKIKEARSVASAYPGNFDIKIGLIGAGMVGKAVCRLLKAYNMDILVYDPYLSDEDAAELGVQKASLEEIFTDCIVVSNHVPNIPSTRGMFSYELFSRMLPNATFINTGRGAQVVEDDLIRILSERPDIIALLDVTDPEPPHTSSPFFTLPNAILTPHIAGSSGRETFRMGDYMLAEFRRFAAGEPLMYEITAEMLPTLA